MKPLQHIVYIDDEEFISELVRIALADIAGFQLSMFSNVHELLQAPPAVAPDLLLLDVMMPDPDGPASLRLLRQRADYATTPAMFVTAETRPAAVQALLDIGAIGVLAKPVDITTLGDEVRALWAKSLAAQA